MLEELRKKPRSVKNLYAFWAAVLFTGVIGGIWLLGLLVKFSTVEQTPLQNIEKTSGAFSQFIDKTKQRFSREKENNTATTTFTTTTPRTVTPTSTKPTILVATSSVPKVQIGTSSRVAE